MTIKAMIQARSGSVRVKNKNIRPFADSSLLEIKISQLMSIKELDGVIVNSNDDEILSIAKKMGCETFKRDPYYATNEVCASDMYVYFAKNFDADVMAFCNCTNPLMKSETIAQGISKYYDVCGEYDSVNSVSPVHEFLFKDGKPINYKLDRQPRSQDLPAIYSLNWGFNIISPETILKTKNMVGTNPYMYEVDDIEGFDIDYPLDFEFAEFLYRKLRLNENGTSVL